MLIKVAGMGAKLDLYVGMKGKRVVPAPSFIPSASPVIQTVLIRSIDAGQRSWRHLPCKASLAETSPSDRQAF